MLFFAARACTLQAHCQPAFHEQQEVLGHRTLMSSQFLLASSQQQGLAPDLAVLVRAHIASCASRHNDSTSRIISRKRQGQSGTMSTTKQLHQAHGPHLIAVQLKPSRLSDRDHSPQLSLPEGKTLAIMVCKSATMTHLCRSTARHHLWAHSVLHVRSCLRQDCAAVLEDGAETGCSSLALVGR